MRKKGARLALCAALLLVITAPPPAAEATFPGRNGVIVFETWDPSCFVTTDVCFGPMAPQFDLWVMQPDGTGLTNITHAPGADTSAVFSPNGKEIVFASNRNGDYDLFLTDPAGVRVKQLTSGVGDDGDPTWSPTGKRIAFFNYSRRSADIVVMRKDGTNRRRIVSWPDAYSLQWSPDGRWLSFVSTEHADSDGIHLVHPNGRGLRRLELGGMYADNPSWSPDGEWLTFSGAETCTSASCEGDIWVVRRDGSELRRVVEDEEFWQSYPVFSPDSRQIVYVNGRDDLLGQGDVWVANLDGSDNRPLLTKPDSYEANLDWQALPD